MIEYRIYRSPSPGAPIDYATPVATVPGTTWASPPLAAGVHLFAVRAAEGGDEEANVEAVARVEVAPDGSDLSNLPRAPIELDARPIAAGALRVTWRPSPEGPKATTYRIYTGVGSPSYLSPAAVVADVGGPGLRAFTLTGLTPGATIAVVVRAANAAGVETNVAVVLATVDAGPPEAVDGLIVVPA